MNRPIFFTLVIMYLLLLIGIAAFAATMAVGANVPSPNQLQGFETLDKDTRQQFWNAMNAAQEKTKKLSEAATQGFQVVLGALIGFMSAVAASLVPPRARPTSGATSGGGASIPGSLPPSGASPAPSA